MYLSKAPRASHQLVRQVLEGRTHIEVVELDLWRMAAASGTFFGIFSFNVLAEMVWNCMGRLSRDLHLRSDFSLFVLYRATLNGMENP